MDPILEKLDKNMDTLVADTKEAKSIAQSAQKSHADLAKQLEDLNGEHTKNAQWRKDLEGDIELNQKALNQLITDFKMIKEGGVMVKPTPSLDFESSLAKAIGENFQIKDANGRVQKGVSTVTKGNSFGFDLDKGTGLYTKAAANMTTQANLTGSPNITYVPQPVLSPRQLINFRDLIPSFMTQTGLIAIFRENFNSGVSPEEGGFGSQTTQGSLKEQVGYDFTNVQFTATYLAGFVRISKQMLQDLLFLQTYLPQMLLRDYFKFENATFEAAQAAAALGSTTTTAANDAEKFIDYITNLEGTNFAPNGIVTTPAVWGKIMKTTVPSVGTSYSVPGGFYINPRTGEVEIAGIPILKATWMPSGTAFIADWTQSQVAQVDGLKVEFFEQDSDNVQRNLITVRVECRCVLVTSQPYGFTYATGL